MRNGTKYQSQYEQTWKLQEELIFQKAEKRELSKEKGVQSRAVNKNESDFFFEITKRPFIVDWNN